MVVLMVLIVSPTGANFVMQPVLAEMMGRTVAGMNHILMMKRRSPVAKLEVLAQEVVENRILRDY